MEVLIHLVTTVILAALIIVFQRYYINTTFLLPFGIGMALGMFLPDVDYLIYVFFLRPRDLSSQRVAQKIENRSITQSIGLMYETRLERRELIFHSAFFQIIFIIFSFLIVTSSGSALGRGIVLAFLLHLFVDEIADLRFRGNVGRWFAKVPMQITPQQMKWYIYIQVLPILLLGLFF